ncbi:MAG: AraC family transcriptional regulator [Planctomycetes bacterium]|nr:AraC family transcriptional regulator [Planctomycetota bacterium]
MELPDCELVALVDEDQRRFPPAEAGAALRPLLTAAVRRAPAFHVRRARRPGNSGLTLVVSGHGIWRCGAQQAALAPGSAYVSAEGSPLEVTGATEVRLVMVGGDGFIALAEAELGVRDGCWRLGNLAECLRLFDLLHDEAGAGRPHAAAIAADLVRALVRTLRRGIAEGGAAAGTHALFLRAAECLGRDPAAPPALAEVARRCGCTPMHLNRVFRRHAGLPPGEWLRQRRLDRAAALLAGGQGVAATAAAVGWSDAYAFTRAFRRRFGQPPGRWARGVAAEVVV